MPYVITKNDSACPSSKPFGVRKKGDGGKLHGCHPSREAARKQQAALYVAENKEQDLEELEQKATEPGEAEVIADEMQEEETEEKGFFTKPELEHAYHEMYGDRDPNEVMCQLLEEQLAQIGMNKEEIEEELEKEAEEVIEDETTLFERFKEWLKARPMKTVGGKKYPSSDFLVVEDPQKVDTWHLQVKRNGTPDRGLAAAAWAALFAPGGHRGNKYAGPGKAAAAKKLRALYSSQGWETPSSGKETGLMVWKEKDGTYRWLARYSNNFRDEDNPPEIISSKSHKRFDEMLGKGEASMPELWLWHRPEWKWGVATWHAYDDSGFPLAAGVVDKGKEALAEAIMALEPELIGVSHGMPKSSIVRDPDDPTVIVEHITREISPLPAWAAANSRTGFSIVKEAQDMAIPKDKKDGLAEDWNLSPEILDQVEAANAAVAEQAKEAGVENKDKDTEATQEQPAAEAKPITREELANVVTAIGKNLTALTERIEALQGEVKEIKESKAAEDEETLTDLFKRAIGHEQARIDGRSSLAKKGPKQTEPEETEVIVQTGKPLVDGIVNELVTGSWLDSFRQQQEV